MWVLAWHSWFGFQVVCPFAWIPGFECPSLESWLRIPGLWFLALDSWLWISRFVLITITPDDGSSFWVRSCCLGFELMIGILLLLLLSLVIWLIILKLSSILLLLLLWVSSLLLLLLVMLRPKEQDLPQKECWLWERPSTSSAKPNHHFKIQTARQDRERRAGSCCWGFELTAGFRVRCWRTFS